ncbi:MAG: S41 family peptidase [Woeseiaceae bacterium]|nr:S41 family peptidase [Woeseiaceae bacterium]
MKEPATGDCSTTFPPHQSPMTVFGARFFRKYWSFVALAGMTMLGASALASGLDVANSSFDLVGEDNLPIGWNIQSNGHVIKVEDGVLIIDSGDQPQATYIKQTLASKQFLTDSLRFSGKIKTEGVQISATLVAIVRGGNQRLFMDDMRDRVVAGDTDWRRYSIDIPAMPDAEELEIGMLLIGPGVAQFDDLTLEQIKARGKTGEAREYVDAAIAILQEQYLKSDSVDWDAILESSSRALREDSSLTDAHGVVASVIARIGDPHSQFIRPRKDEQVASVDTHKPSVFIETQSRLGYLKVPKWSSPADSLASAEFITKAHRGISQASFETCGWVVDLTNNTGGNMWPMLAALGPLLGRENVGGFDRPHKPSGSTKWWYRAGISGARENGREIARTREIEQVMPMFRDSVPIAVVVGSDTASSGEALAIAFLGRDNTRLFGQSTSGWTTANVAIPLSDDAILVFPSGYMADADGRTYPDGITPDEIVDPANARLRAEQWLLKQKACNQDKGASTR